MSDTKNIEIKVSGRACVFRYEKGQVASLVSCSHSQLRSWLRVKMAGKQTGQGPYTGSLAKIKYDLESDMRSYFGEVPLPAFVEKKKLAPVPDPMPSEVKTPDAPPEPKAAAPGKKETLPKKAAAPKKEPAAAKAKPEPADVKPNIPTPPPGAAPAAGRVAGKPMVDSGTKSSPGAAPAAGRVAGKPMVDSGTKSSPGAAPAAGSGKK